MVKIQRFVQLNKSELQINKIINSEGFGLISLTKSRKEIARQNLLEQHLTLHVPIPDEKKNKLKFLFSHSFVVPQKVLWRP